ncbi:MAG: DUF294 nucleotidyltransferase-like domain-containing protein [Bacteroidia bacterium]|nr:DUF294 nucleotidyltransferase-like domain-containing protein [Bacteroidia bacterium]
MAVSLILAENDYIFSMIAHAIAARVADFLYAFPPFSFLPREEVEKLAATIQVRYHTHHEFVFRQGEEAEQFFFILHKGKVEIQEESEGSTRVIDLCDIGDSFGVRAMLSGNAYIASARITNEALIYAIPKEIFLPLMDRYPKVAMFYASGFASGQTVVRTGSKGMVEARKQLSRSSRPSGLFQEEDVIVLKPTSGVVFCLPHNSVQEAAQIMTEYKVGSVVVANQELHPMGILTNTDFARKIGTGAYTIYERVGKVMSSPVICVRNGLTVAEVILLMMRKRIRHLVVTEDGSPDSRFIGIISEHDVLLSQGNNPAVLVKQMYKSRNMGELAEIRSRAEQLLRSYLEQEVSISFITSTATEINDSLIYRCIELSLQELEEEGMQRPAEHFCWLSLGSEGRGEQLLRTDQDNALIYEDPTEECQAEVASYFLRLGTLVTDKLEACGFAHCPGEIMASNPAWNMSLSGWKQAFSEWIRVPDPKALMHGTIFFDFRAGFGDEVLAEKLSSFLFQTIHDRSNFLNYFAQNALQNPPPLSFLNQLIIERGGSHKDEFDIKLRGMMPLADAARVLLLSHQQGGITNTVGRFEKLAELEPANADLYEEAAMAYEGMLRHRALNGFQKGNSGRFIDPKSLNKIEKQTLKYSFRTIEELQTILKTRFSLTVFR